MLAGSGRGPVQVGEYSEGGLGAAARLEQQGRKDRSDASGFRGGRLFLQNNKTRTL